jgi:deoxyadenosine/deoxycytidine kinase
MQTIRIGIVGPCGAGKSSLAERLSPYYSTVRAIAQEHSYVPTMWRRITNPDILIYLDASYSVTVQRRKLNWTDAEYRIELDRLENARKNADIYKSWKVFWQSVNRYDTYSPVFIRSII